MRNEWLFVLAFCGVCGAVIAAGKVERDVSLESVGQIWADVLQDADSAARKMARVNDRDEIRLGADLSAKLLAAWPRDAARSPQVELAGRRMLVMSERKRPGLPYSFHAVDSAEVNAFALPGGQVFVTRGMLDFVENDSELAMVIGHEIAHVDLRHAIGRYQFQTAADKIGVGAAGQAVDAVRTIGMLAYSETEELEADAAGFRFARSAGYDVGSAVRVMERLHKSFGSARSTASTPAGELARSVGGLVSGYFRTHPDSEKRVRILRQLAEN